MKIMVNRKVYLAVVQTMQLSYITDNDIILYIYIYIYIPSTSCRNTTFNTTFFLNFKQDADNI